MLYLKGTVSKNLTAYIERVIAHLGLKRVVVDIAIFKECDGGAGGYCNGEPDDIQIEIARHDPDGKLPYKNLLINIAHELIHGQQIVSGRMINKGLSFTTDKNGDLALINVVVWDGKEISGLAYNDQPWEIDAYGREQEVYNLCK